MAVLDAVGMLVGGIAAEAIRYGSLGNSSADQHGISYAALSLMVMPVWGFVMAISGAYELRHLGSGSEEYRRVLAAGWRFLAVVAVVAFVFKYDVARGVVAFAIPLATVIALVQRWLARRWLHRQQARGRFVKRALVVGAERSCRQLAAQVRALPFGGMSVVGACVPADDARASDDDGEAVPVIGDSSRVLDAVLETSAEVVLIADTVSISNEELRQLAWRLEGSGVALLVTPEITDVAGPRLSVRPVSGLPLLHVDEPELTGVRRIVKEGLDRTVAAFLLVAILPLLLVAGVAIRLTSPGPALFKQVRVGIRGKRFTIWKLRTMGVDAEESRVQLEHLNEAGGLLFKMRDDPRVTSVGRWLRRWSIDELPQLWNVVRGDMSLVGPRPPLPSEVENYCDRVRRRLLVKPGLTGLWQVSGRSTLPWDEAVRLDLYYVENWSPSMDMTILIRTVLAILRRSGAY
jgi:exopolysaccharide biosynthesis polyprenyl glycosylphosphotransferase